MAENEVELKSKQTLREPDESSLIRAAKQDPRAFSELYLLYVERVFKYLFSRLGNVHEAEDITAQTFLAAFESFDRFHLNGQFAPWLFSIARNKAIGHYRRHQKIASVNVDEMLDVPVEFEPLRAVIQSEQTAALSKLIEALPEEERELLRLRFLAEMSFPEIAKLLHRNPEAVKKSIYRLLARLHSQLEVNHE